MKSTDNEPHVPADPNAAPAVDEAKSATDPLRKKKNKRVANVVVVIMGVLLYVDLFAQPGCGDDATGGTGNVIDAAVDTSVSIDASIDSPGMSIIDSAMMGGDCFATAIGKTFTGNLGCSLGGMSTLTDSDGYLLAPFGSQNTAGQRFNPMGTPNEAVANGVIVFGKPNHKCTLKCTAGTPNPSLSVMCVEQMVEAGNPGMCTELYTVGAPPG